MARMRVHELAKEFNVINKDLIDRILKLGIQVKNHMSTLSDTAVLKIRQHFIEAAAEEVDQKRIGRTVIRRRKKTTEEAGREGESPVETGAETAVPDLVVEVGAARDIALEAPEETLQEQDETPSEPGSTAPPVQGRETEVKGGHKAPLAEPSPDLEPEEAIAKKQEEEQAMAGTEVVPTIVEARVVKMEPSPAPLVEDMGKEEEPAEAGVPAPHEKPVSAKPHIEAAAQPEKTQASPPLKVVPADAAPLAQAAKPDATVAPEQAVKSDAADEAEDAEGPSKSKKTKKRRRKKTQKDEPARIIKLPEIIPDEPEEEPEITLLPPQKLHLVVEDVETKDAARKKRGRSEEAEKEAAGRNKRRGPVRKEVFEREDLYSKKELAALAGRERAKDRDKGGFLKEPPKPEPVVPKVGRRKVKVDDAITVANLAKQMGVKASEIIKKLLLIGLPANMNQAIDFDTAALMASDFDFEIEKVGFEEEDIILIQEDRQEDRTSRPPVVTVMGHVDHGKTSLLDAIRHTDVIGGEAGGITQHIGAYYVKLEKGVVVFLDTPGHEAFTAMRARGAKVTDIVILVVAADDGVMQQTIEAINHAKAAEVPIIVAINKIDKPNANIDRVKRELSDHGLLPEEWGGNTTMVEVSAKKKIGIDNLLEMVLLQAEIMELKASPQKSARGRVVEAKLDRGRGPVATILVQDGTIKTGDAYVCGTHYGRVRNMFNDRGQRIEQAGPAMPVEVLGLSGVPNAGDDFAAVADEKQAKLVADHRLAKHRERELSSTGKITLERLYEQIQEGAIKEVNVILRTDVQGSLEAIIDSLQKLTTSEVKVHVIHSATGAITETDIMLASASNAIVIGFNVRSDAKVHELAEQEHVDVRYYDIIYQIVDDIKDAMVGMLEPEYKENVIGHARVIQLFHVPKIGVVTGCMVMDGRLERGARARILRNNVVIYDGKIVSLRRFKDDAKEVRAGFDCGVSVENFNDAKLDDVFEAFELQEIKATLNRHEGKEKEKEKEKE